MFEIIWVAGSSGLSVGLESAGKPGPVRIMEISGNLGEKVSVVSMKAPNAEVSRAGVTF